ncbi:MAG: universal stress protein [Bacteroidetes bacterium]|nr:universal stress protein [Fibrella sp.]
MKKILLLTDFSAASHNALQFARSIFSDTVADFHLLCAHPAEPNYLEGSKPVAKSTRLTHANPLHAIVTKLRREATNDWHTFRSSSLPGKALEVVEQVVKAEVYDFVVIGPQPDDDSTDVLFDNSAIALVRQLRANVLLVPVNAIARPIRQVVLAVDFANLKNCKLLDPVKEFVLLRGAGLTLLNIDTPDKKAIDIEREAHIRQFLLPIEPTIARLKATSAKEGIDAYLNEHPVDLLVTIPQRESRTDALTGSSVIHSSAHALPVPLLRLYDDGSNDLPHPINGLTNGDYAL